MKKLDPQYLNTLQQVKDMGYKDAIIAGGAVRDLYMGRRVSDIDIFISVDQIQRSQLQIGCDLTLASPTLELKAALGLKENEHEFLVRADLCSGPNKQTASGYSRNNIVCVWNVSKYEINEKGNYQWNKYQLIIINNVSTKTYVEEYFDIGLCMCWNDGVSGKYTNEFLEDARNKTITVRGRMNGIELDKVLKTHVQKIKRKFLDHKIVIDTTKLIEYYKGEGLA